MPEIILTDHVVSISELKANPQKAVRSGDGDPVAVLNHGQVEFYCVPPELFKLMLRGFDGAHKVTSDED